MNTQKPGENYTDSTNFSDSPTDNKFPNEVPLIPKVPHRPPVNLSSPFYKEEQLAQKADVNRSRIISQSSGIRPGVWWITFAVIVIAAIILYTR